MKEGKSKEEELGGAGVDEVVVAPEGQTVDAADGLDLSVLLKHIPSQVCQVDFKDVLVEAKRWNERAKRVRANADNAVKKAIMWEEKARQATDEAELWNERAERGGNVRVLIRDENGLLPTTDDEEEDEEEEEETPLTEEENQALLEHIVKNIARVCVNDMNFLEEIKEGAITYYMKHKPFPFIAMD